MINPCKECIVRASCLDPCDEAMNHFRIMVEEFDPDRPATIDSGFLSNMLLKVKQNTSKDQEIVINYSDGYVDTPCRMVVEHGIILRLETVNYDYNPM